MDLASGWVAKQMAKFLVASTETFIEDYGIERDGLKGIAEFRSTEKDPNTHEKFVALAKGADVVLHNSGYKITAEDMDSLPKLRMIICTSVGFDNVDIEAATERGIPVSNVPDYGSNEVAEHATAMILALERQLFTLDRAIRSGTWGHATHQVLELHSPTAHVVGLVAFGRIARRVAKRVQACGFDVIAYDPYVPRWDFELQNVERVDSLIELMKRSDYVSVHVPHNSTTTHLIGAKEIAAMKPTAFFVITGRGKTMDQKALYKALKSKKIAGAGLDVFENEPLDRNDPIMKLDNVILTPHVAGFTLESNDRRRRYGAIIAAEALTGKGQMFVVNPEVYSKTGGKRKRSVKG